MLNELTEQLIVAPAFIGRFLKAMGKVYTEEKWDDPKGKIQLSDGGS